MSRSSWKFNNINYSFDNFLQVENKQLKKTKKLIKTDARNLIILPEYVGLYFSVYNGVRFFNVLITKTMVGQKLGEFSPTRKKPVPKKAKQKKR